MLYEEDGRFPRPRSDDSPLDRREPDERQPDERALDPRQLLRDIDALVAAGLVVPVRGRDGELRVVPTAPLELDAEAPAS